MVDVIPGQCALVSCTKLLPKYRRKWCSDECAMASVTSHSWGYARPAALKRDGYKCVKCGSTGWLEVNHIEPRKGMGYGPGCHHHQTNLETLCHNCHVRITNMQRSELRNQNQSRLLL